MKLFLIRHGESEWNRLNKVQGLGDPGLSLEGKLQVERLAERLAQEEIDLIYTSPLLRARQTAQAISDIGHAPIKELENLREITLGVWEGKSFEEIGRLFKKDYKIWLKSPSKTRIAQAEKLTAFKKRVTAAFKTITKNNAAENIAVVTHNGVISVFLSYILNANFDQLFHLLCINNAGITKVDFENKIFTVFFINDTCHLHDLRPLDDRNPGVIASTVKK